MADTARQRPKHLAQKLWEIVCSSIRRKWNTRDGAGAWWPVVTVYRSVRFSYLATVEPKVCFGVREVTFDSASDAICIGCRKGCSVIRECIAAIPSFDNNVMQWPSVHSFSKETCFLILEAMHIVGVGAIEYRMMLHWTINVQHIFVWRISEQK